MDLIEQSTAAMVASQHWKVLGMICKLRRNIYLEFNFCSSHHGGIIISILYIILGILQGCLLGPTLKINMVRVLCSSFAHIRI